MDKLHDSIVNPLLISWDTPFESPPFDKIETAHFRPAVTEAIKAASLEIENITANTATPDFKNTVEALEISGETLGKITSVLFNLNSAETNKELQAAAQEISPLLTRFSNDITLNEKLFGRIKSVYDNRNNAGLDTEQLILVERKYRSFILGGAGLAPEKRKRFREASEELSEISLKFEENVLEETNSFELHLTEKSDLEGLPESIVEMAAAEAVKRDKTGWVFTLHYPSYIPFMQYSSVRHLREKMLKAYSSRSFRGNEFDNRDLVKRIVNLRLEIAQMLGFETYADMALVERMADRRDKVEKFLEELFIASHPAAVRDFETVKEYAIRNGHEGNIERWDWAYFSEKLKKEKFSIDDEILKPFFNLNSVCEAIFNLANILYGISFTKIDGIPVYHPEVTAWEVNESNGKHLAVFLTDFHPRPGKSGGAWMTCYREQSKGIDKEIRPIVSIVTNFSRASETKPSLLTFNELTTFLHEFGHALHAILSDCTYESLSCTNVARDFVELPSQIMENWAFEKEWLDLWASHYQTGEKIPEEIIKSIREASTFNEGYACDRQLSFGFLDMAWHTVTSAFGGDVKSFEKEIIMRTDLFPPIDSANMSCSFTHLFGGGYAAGYYGYKWAEVLDADAFEYFTEKGILNRDVAHSFRKNILEKGGTEKPMVLYKNFRGHEPSLEPFLKRSGLK
jgi:peptidyl-dipeptidase Dcp